MPPISDPTLPYRITVRNFIGITLMAGLIFLIGGVILVKLDPTIFTEERAVLDKLLWFSLLATAGVLASTGYVLASRTTMGWAIIGLTRPEARWILIAVATAAALLTARAVSTSMVEQSMNRAPARAAAITPPPPR